MSLRCSDVWPAVRPATPGWSSSASSLERIGSSMPSPSPWRPSSCPPSSTGCCARAGTGRATSSRLPIGTTASPKPSSGYDAHASDRHWVWFGTTWERDSCYVPVLADAHDTAPIGMFSGQMLTVSVPVPSITALLVCFEVAIDVLGRDDWDPTWCDLITAPPQPDAQRSDEGTQRQLTLHEALAPMRRSWASSHPCWDPTVMPFAWTEDPVAAAVDAMLGR